MINGTTGSDSYDVYHERATDDDSDALASLAERGRYSCRNMHVWAHTGLAIDDADGEKSIDEHKLKYATGDVCQ